MMRLLATLALLLAVRTVAAQTASDDRRAVARPRTFDNEIGLRFGAQIGLGRDDGPELQALSLDYARYGWRNIGLRTGVTLFLNGDVENYLSVPLHFSWRSGRIASAWRRGETVAVAPDPYGGYYDSDPAEPYGRRSVDEGSFFWNLLLSILPTAFELHTGFTPGVMCGPLSRAVWQRRIPPGSRGWSGSASRVRSMPARGSLSPSGASASTWTSPTIAT